MTKFETLIPKWMKRAAAASLLTLAVVELSAQDLSTGAANSYESTDAALDSLLLLDLLPTPPTLSALPVSPFKPLSLSYIGDLSYSDINSSHLAASSHQNFTAPKIAVPYRTPTEANSGTSAPNELSRRRPWDSGGNLALFTRGRYAIALSGRHSSYPSMGFSNTLTLGQTWQATDGITIQGGVYTSDNLYHTSRFKDFGVSGSVAVEVTDGVKFVGFGAHSIYNSASGASGAPVPPMMYTGDLYGGGIRFRVAGKLGLEAGARRDYNAFTREWDTTPYVLPVIY